MSETEGLAASGLPAELVRWGLRADAVSADATRTSTELEDRMRMARRSVEVALRHLQGVAGLLDPTEERVRRIEEVARDSSEAATRTDLLALNFQVEAARLEDDRGLDRVAHEIRSLADRGTRSGFEIDELVQTLLKELARLRSAWSQAQREVQLTQESMDRALRAADRTGRLLAESRSLAAQFSAGVASASASGPSAGEGAPSKSSDEAAARLAAAAEVRGDTIERLARAVAGGLRRTGAALEQEAGRADETANRVEAFEGKLGRLMELVQAADEMARRAKQLAINADLAATRSDDPAFGLFAEEARRLSDQAERTADNAQIHLGIASQAHSPAVDACRQLAGNLSAIGRELGGLISRFAEGLDAQEADPHVMEGLSQVWRSDRAAAEELAQARANWRQARGGSGVGSDDDSGEEKPPPSKL